ncbi:MAG: hypothetical protein COZ06_22695 [Armatimonadetes bacterium CG_4_10_14_3_um_filter_66_18]|nr:hypothetical protein [Armatimonadota bacterium]PIY43496.1 MAG: hypothetical protein COZ06_22695 [Armatimonadetes bacterium CG_4_10_14_3_um_filter_66_18]PIZ47831.1 MAG: hypothetical protein COY42_07525 [Armatimonadetes bacterium CG_4_10_14_0_8_um_filter_66_14]
MRFHATLLRISLLLCLLPGSLGLTQPLGSGAPAADTPAVEPGDDVLTFSGVPATVAELRFVAEGYRDLARLRLGPAVAGMLSGSWAPAGNGRRPVWATQGTSPASLRCRVPHAAAGVVIRYAVFDDLFAPLDVSLNGSKVALQPVHGLPRECVIRIRRDGGRAKLTGAPLLNLWELRGLPPGPVFDETHCELDLSPGNDPLSCGEYRLHVSYVADPRRAGNPASPATAKLLGLDLTQYDGYVIAAKATDATHFSAGLKDTSNFSWRGAGAALAPGEWSAVAIPFALHTNSTTAGDGVLKLSELDHLKIQVGGRSRGAAVTGEYWVAPPKFYTGAPPEGVPVADKSFREVCSAVNLSPERRKPQYFEGTAIQALCPQGDFLWLGTDRGLVKCSRTQPGMPLAQYSMTEGLVDNDVQALYAEGDMLWIGTPCGLSKFDGHAFRNYTADDGLLPGPVMALAADRKALYLGMARGLARLDRATGAITARKGKGGWSPESTGGQGVPVQEGRGVFCDSLAVDTDGTLWHAAAGLTHSASEGKRLSHFGGTTKRVLAVYLSGENVWCVTARGIDLLRKDDGEEPDAVYGIARREGIGGERHSAFVTCAYPESGGLWLGYSDGIGWFNLKDRTCHWSPTFSVRMGSLVAQCLYADARSVWVGTDNGLMVFPKAEARQPWKVLEYSAPTDLWAAGVSLDTDADRALGCDDGAPDEGEPTEAGGQSVVLDENEGAPNSPGALRLDFALDKAASSGAVLAQQFSLDLADCTGIELCAKTDGRYRGKPREFFVDVRFAAVVGKRNRDKEIVLRQVIQVDDAWRAFQIPFAKMRAISGPLNARHQAVPRSIRLIGVTVGRTVADFQCPGDAGKLWIDRLQWTNSSGRTRA